MICLDAKTGEPVSSFGDNGIVDLTQGLRWAVNKKHYTNTSPPIVYKEPGHRRQRRRRSPGYRNDPPGDVARSTRGPASRSGRFNTIPQPGEFGHDTWEDGSWKFTGHTNVWAPMSLDERAARLSAGQHAEQRLLRRPPARRQSVRRVDRLPRRRHRRAAGTTRSCITDLWDYDPASAPNLVTITVDGRRIDAVVQLTKQGFAFVFDRVTGEPVWPIEERPVPPSDVAGERAWPTQPFPQPPGHSRRRA